jgi:hypothetical protein
MVGIAIPTSMAVLAIGSGAARAQTTYNLYGSDTCTQLIVAGIAGSGAHINYINTGSGQGEKNIAQLSGQNSLQSIAPMSRNFVPTVLSLAGFAPTNDQVMCLDAAVVAFGNISGHIQNLPCSATSGSNTCDTTCDITVNPMAIVLGGYPSGCPGNNAAVSGATTSECAHPQRLAAIKQLRAQQGARIDHYFRRDDKSGTQDSFREYLNFSRWCNGKSEGNTNAPGSNLLNYDLDPVRTGCTNEHGQTVALTRCTYYPLNYPAAGATCYDGDVLAANDPNNTEGVAIPCTQGFIVAQSENDPGVPDITKSIGLRVGLDLNGQTMGGAGLAVVNQGSAGASLNTVSFEDFNVRGGHYPMWRRLFIQRNTNAANAPWNVPADRIAQENILYNWLTNRGNMCGVCSTNGFYPPIADCSQACSDPLNVTCVPALAGLGTPKMNIGAETQACDTAYPCVANGQIAASAGASCGGTTVAGTAYCPAIPTLASTYACNLSSKCSSSSCSGTPLSCQ